MAANMTEGFDPDDKHSWYFGPLAREDTNNLLQAEEDSGVFLVRDSSSIKGDFVLCVKEDNKVSHYIINKIQVDGVTRFRIGDQEFPDIPSLLNFYRTHYLDTTALVRPAPREQYIAKYSFKGEDPEDLPFKKGEILTILQRDEEKWWTARNCQGQIGMVPEPYIAKYAPESGDNKPQAGSQEPPAYRDPSNIGLSSSLQNGSRELPAKAVVTRQRIPNAYDPTNLRLEPGDEILVTAMHLNGQWEGELNGKRGFFPCTYINFFDSDNHAEEDESTPF